MLPAHIKFRSLECPALATFNGITYVIPGWHVVTTGTTLKEVQDRWERLTYGDKPNEKFSNNDIKEKVISQRTGEEYTVSFHSNYWSCTCVGYGFHRKCKHIEQVKQKHNIIK